MAIRFDATNNAPNKPPEPNIAPNAPNKPEKGKRKPGGRKEAEARREYQRVYMAKRRAAMKAAKVGQEAARVE